jgi:hypothetical protein
MQIVNEYNIVSPIFVLRTQAFTFPEGILDAYTRLDLAIPNYQLRRHFGISFPHTNGKIQYWAAMEVLESDCGNHYGQELFKIEAGTYACIDVKNFQESHLSLKQAFQTLTSLPNINPEGYCLEMMLSQTDVKCMVKLLS